MSSVPASAPLSSTSSSSSGAVESPKAHSIDWLTGAVRDVEADARALLATDIREIDTDVPVYASALLTRITKFEDVRELVSGVAGKELLETGDLSKGVFWAGMVQGLIHDIPTCKELIDRIMLQAEEIIARMQAQLRA